MDANVLMGVLAATGVTLGVFIAIKIYRKDITSRILSFLLIAWSIRISKSVAFPLLGYTPIGLLYAGLGAMLIAGPLLYNFILLKKNQRIKFRYIDVLVLLIPIPAIIDNSEATFRLSYLLALAFYFFYFFIASVTCYKNHLLKQTLIKELLIAAFLMGSLFLVQFIGLNANGYIISALISSVLLFRISTKLNFTFSDSKSGERKKLNISSTVLKEIMSQVTHLLATEKLYEHEDITLKKISKTLNIPQHHISYAVNEVLNTSFKKLVNNYRLKAAAEKLRDPAAFHLSIESIAFDCGFNSTSNFYSSFKKLYKLTPNDYRQQAFLAHKGHSSIPVLKTGVF